MELSQPSSSDPLPPAQALQSLRDSLLVTFKAEFKAAAELKDEQATSRYFKLFPVIDAKVSSIGGAGRSRSLTIGLSRTTVSMCTAILSRRW